MRGQIGADSTLQELQKIQAYIEYAVNSQIPFYLLLGGARTIFVEQRQDMIKIIANEG